MEGGGREKIKVWEDRWLPTNHLPKPVSCKPSNCPVSTVVELRNKEGEDWDRQPLNQLFNEEEVALITSIPLSALGTKDRIIWKLSANGQFSVSLGYELAMGIKR